MKKDLRVVFMGTPEFSLNVLEGLIENYNVVGVVSQPDKEVGRKKILTPTPVKILALENNIKVVQPRYIFTDYMDVVNMRPDVIITCAYGQIIPKILLDLPRYGCINVHASLLPKLRGGAPIHKSIIDGYNETGITIMYMAEKMDDGDIISQKSIKIEDDFNMGILSEKLSMMGRDLLLETLPNIIIGNINPIKQDESLVTYAWNIKRKEEKIDFNLPVKNVFNKIRGLNPIPGAYCLLDGKIVKIYDVCFTNKKYNNNCGEIVSLDKDSFSICLKDGELIVKSLQFEGKKKMLVKDFINSRKDLLGKVFR